MRKLLLFLPAKLQMMVIVGLTIVSAFIISILVNLIFDLPLLAANVDLVSAVYQVLGTLYAVLLAFAVSGVWQNFSKAVLAVQAEANAISDLVHIIEYSAMEKSQMVRNLALSYLKLVVEKEWYILGRVNDALAVTHEISREASVLFTHQVLSIKPMNNADSVLFGQILTLLNSWLDARRTRIVIAKGNSAAALWPLLIGGALVVFGFHGLFVIKAPAVWIVLLLTMSFIVGVAFYLIFSLDSPFTGKPFVDSGPFQWAINWMENEGSPKVEIFK